MHFSHHIIQARVEGGEGGHARDQGGRNANSSAFVLTKPFSVKIGNAASHGKGPSGKIICVYHLFFFYSHPSHLSNSIFLLSYQINQRGALILKVRNYTVNFDIIYINATLSLIPLLF